MAKNKVIVSALVAVLMSVALSAWSENKSDSDIFAGLKRGERVTVTTRNNVSYTGLVKSVINDKIELDISYDDPVLKGSFSFRTRDIKAILSRASLSAAEKERIADQKEQIVPAKNPSSAGVSNESEPAPAEKEKGPVGDNELLDLLNRFPQGEQWNDKIYRAIKDKNAFLRSVEESGFLENYQDWLKALELKAKGDSLDFFRRFLPENGWGEEKHTELITKYIRLKIGLTSEEQEFVDKYELWKKTRPVYEEEEKKKQEEEQKQSEQKQPPPPAPEEEQPSETPAGE